MSPSRSWASPFPFAVQFGFGWILDLWGSDAAGAYPAEAYGAALGTLLVLQGAALLWFVDLTRRLGRGDL